MRDIDEVFARLSQSPFRRRFRLGAKERNYLVTKGLPTILDHAREFTIEVMIGDRSYGAGSGRNKQSAAQAAAHAALLTIEHDNP